MKTWKLLLPIPFVAALVAMMPQGPEDNPAAEVSTILHISEMQYVDALGKTTVVAARNLAELRLLEDSHESLRIELLYDNGDYSLVNAQSLHVLRSGHNATDVRFVRSGRARMRFPKLP